MSSGLSATFIASALLHLLGLTALMVGGSLWSPYHRQCRPHGTPRRAPANRIKSVAEPRQIPSHRPVEQSEPLRPHPGTPPQPVTRNWRRSYRQNW
jgi:hypothetical protein